MTARLFLEITDDDKPTIYQLVPLDPHPLVATRAWKMLTCNGREYHVSVCKRGWVQCTCASGSYRDEPCKHTKALIEMGILPRKSEQKGTT